MVSAIGEASLWNSLFGSRRDYPLFMLHNGTHTMTPSNTPFHLSAKIRSAVLALGCAISFAVVQVPATRASDAASLKPMDDKAPSLPLAASFEKVADAEGGPYTLSLKNTSDATLKVSAKILLSVYFHDDTKARNLPEHSIDPGMFWSIPGLAAGDKVVVTANGFAPLELTVP
jgi:hypothetical protein